MALVNEGGSSDLDEKFKQMRKGLTITGDGARKAGRARLASLLIGIGVGSLTWSEQDELRWEGDVVDPGDTLRWNGLRWQLVRSVAGRGK